jgi:hypothetical protein
MLVIMMKSLSLIFLHLKTLGLDFYMNFSYLFFANVRFGVFFIMVRADGTVVLARTNGRQIHWKSSCVLRSSFLFCTTGWYGHFYRTDGRKTYSKFSMVLRFSVMLVRPGGMGAYARTDGR